MTHVAFGVTLWHEFVGQPNIYLPSPILAIRRGTLEWDVQGMMATLALIAITGMRNPKLMSNWTHILPDKPEIRKLHAELMEDLQNITKSVERRNTNRPVAVQSFNPKFFEISVSV